MIPVQIKVNNSLFIKWDDETTSEIELIKLRRLCPCATCISERENQSKSFIPLFQDSQIKIDRVIPVGSYAIQINWKDGHSTGIYEFPFLKNLSRDLS